MMLFLAGFLTCYALVWLYSLGLHWQDRNASRHYAPPPERG